MPSCINVDVNDFTNPYCLLQLADDASILADSIVSLKNKIGDIMSYSVEKHLEINILKTKYMEMCNDPSLEDILFSDGNVVNAVKPSEGHPFLGFHLSYSDNIADLILKNFNKKQYVIVKFYDWLEHNASLPFYLKLRVLYSCMFSTLLYSCEVWGDLKEIKDRILLTERKALKRCLGVKLGTTDDIIYFEIKRPDIISLIKIRQRKFMNKLIAIEPNMAIVKAIILRYMHMDNPGNMIHYYFSIPDNVTEENIREREERIKISDSTMHKRYRLISNLSYAQSLYKSNVDDEYRKTITRWRLSSHRLHIETGRYKNPKIPRENRICSICCVIEDENHAIFNCKAHYFIRIKYTNLLIRYSNVREILNPSCDADIRAVGSFLSEIEKNMIDLKMIV